VAKKGLGRPRRAGHPCTDSAHHACSLRLAQIRAWGELLEGSRRGRGRRADSGRVRRGGEGLGCRGAAGGGAGQRSRERCEEGDDPDLWGHRVSESRERALHFWLGPGQADGPGGRGRGERSWRMRAFGPG
jgi:hypothetical protein